MLLKEEDVTIVNSKVLVVKPNPSSERRYAEIVIFIDFHICFNPTLSCVSLSGEDNQKDCFKNGMYRM